MHQDQKGRLILPSEQERASLPPDGGPAYNRLIFESSPYLLQHAENPVNWYPWGPDAFARAEAENKPVFLSIGYATCHWCHVMERESFEVDEVAALLNQVFVCIKVDKEERPDIDDIYMNATQAMTGQGGWPMTVMLNHQKRPFFAGTYFPRNSIGGRIGLMELVGRVQAAWLNQRESLEEEATNMVAQLQQMTSSRSGKALNAETLALGAKQLADRFDEEQGGFGNAPKFPTPHNLTFLLRHSLRTGEHSWSDMVVTTLRNMRWGGIFDQVGFGFHRYSTDAQWLLPHFEKMLYDQALLTGAALEAYQHTGLPEMAAIAREVITYVLRDMRDASGGFYCAEDADSEGEEGKFYVWRPEEVISILGPEKGGQFCEIFQIVPGGNFRDESTGHKPGESIAHMKASMADAATKYGVTLEQLLQSVEESRQHLFAVRELRIHPLKDDKILTDWNGLMIAALANAGRIFDEAQYRDAAVAACAFIDKYLQDEQGNLLKRFRQGQAGLPAHLDDYAFYIWGLIETYGATYDCQYLSRALQLCKRVSAKFLNQETGAFFFTASDGEELILRASNIYDGAIPSGNSVMCFNLLRLSKLTGDTELWKLGSGVLDAFSGQVGHYPTMANHLLGALDFSLGPTTEVVVVGNRGAADTQAMLSAINGRFLPRTTLLFKDGDFDTNLSLLAPYTEPMRMIDGCATAYVCRDFTCDQPSRDLTIILAHLSG